MRVELLKLYLFFLVIGCSELVADIKLDFQNKYAVSPYYAELMISYQDLASEESNVQEMRIAVYKEWEEDGLYVYVKSLDSTDTVFGYIEESKVILVNSQLNKIPYLLSNKINVFFLDYIDWVYYQSNFKKIKEDRKHIFYQVIGKFNNKESPKNIDTTIKYSKLYHIPVRYIIREDKENIVIEVTGISSINNMYYPSSYEIKSKDFSLKVIVKEAIFSRDIEINDDFKISGKEFSNTKDNIKDSRVFEIANLKMIHRIKYKDIINIDHTDEDYKKSYSPEDTSKTMNEFDNLQNANFN